MKKILDKTFFLYVALGILNYSFCSVVMLLFRHALKVPELYCMYISFFLQTTISFILNRFVTFRGIRLHSNWPLRFVMSVSTCVLMARILLKRLLEYLMTLPFFYNIADWLHGLLVQTVGLRLSVAEFRKDLILLACTFTYCVINYIGQRYYVFSPLKQDIENPQQSACKTFDESSPDQRSVQEST